jgi:excisionase family DNA binding protein
MGQAEPILVSVADGARMLSLCRATFYKLLNTGEVRAVKHGRRTLIPVDELRKYALTLPDMQPTQPS